MQKLLTVTSISALMLGAALPAQAATFATIAGAKLSWTRSTSGDVTGTLSSTGNNTFDFLVDGLPTGLAGSLVLNSVGETETNATTSTPGGGLTIYTQQGISGTFTEIYKGPTLTIDGVHLVQNVTTLLSGALSNGILVATKQRIGGTTTSFAGNFTFTGSDFSSPFLALGGDESLDITVALGGGNWNVVNRSYGGTTYSTLAPFSGTGSGNLLAASVTEPAAWMLMLGGVGFSGALLRRRRLVAGLPA
jgi:hypothetical protein